MKRKASDPILSPRLKLCLSYHYSSQGDDANSFKTSLCSAQRLKVKTTQIKARWLLPVISVFKRSRSGSHLRDNAYKKRRTEFFPKEKADSK